MNRWTMYPAMVNALHQRDWTTLTNLYRNGAPGEALFPDHIGQSTLDPFQAQPGEGTMNLPAVLLYVHGMYLDDSVHEDYLSVDLLDDTETQALRDLLTAWQAAGGLWDDLGVLSEPSETQRYRSLSLLAMEHMVPPAPEAFVTVYFESDVQPWLETFLEAGWSPLPVEGLPMVHRALQCGRLMWAELLLEHAGVLDAPAQWPLDRLDNTAMHALGVEQVYAFASGEAREERSAWLREQPLNAWDATNANGHTPIERWLLEPNLHLVEDGLAVVESQGRTLPLRPAIRDQALKLVEGFSHSHLQQKMITALTRWQAHWEGHVLHQSVDDALDGPDDAWPTHRGRRL